MPGHVLGVGHTEDSKAQVHPVPVEGEPTAKLTRIPIDLHSNRNLRGVGIEVGVLRTTWGTGGKRCQGRR